MSKKENEFEEKLKEKFGDVFIVSQKEASDPEFFKAMQKFQYGEIREISDKGFDKMKKMTELKKKNKSKEQKKM